MQVSSLHPSFLIPHSCRAGQSLLVVTILIGGIILVTSVALALTALSIANSGYGYQAAIAAEAAATAGAEDGLLQLARNSSFANAGGYSVAVGSSTATVTVTQNSPSANFVTVLSASTVFLRTRKVQVVAALNPATGQATVVLWNEIQ